MLKVIARLLLLLIFPLCVVEGYGESGSASIVVQDALGQLLNPTEVQITVSAMSGRDFSAQFHDNTADLPYGSYLLKAWSPGFVTRRQPLIVWQKQMTFRVGLLLGAPEGSSSRSRVSGVIGPLRQSADGSIVRLVPLAHSAFIQEDTVAPDGRFDFGEVEHGEYLLTVVSWAEGIDDRYRPTVIYTKQVTVSHDPQDFRIEVLR